MTDALFLELESLVGPATMTELCKRYLGHVPSLKEKSQSESKEYSLSVSHCAVCTKKSCTPFTCMAACSVPPRSPLLMPPATIQEIQKSQGHVPDADWESYRRSPLDNAFFTTSYIDHDHRPATSSTRGTHPK